MDEIQQIKMLIQDPHTSIEKLQQLQQLATDKLGRIEQVRQILSKVGPDDWTYEAYQEVLRADGTPESDVMTRGEWDQLFPDLRAQLRTNLMQSAEQGLQGYQDIKTMIAAALAKPRAAKKSAWQFWR